MGKFLDILNQVGKVASAGIGFVGRRTQAKAKAAIIIAALDGTDAALAEAAIKGGAEGVLLPALEGRESLAEGVKSLEAVLEVIHGGGAAAGLALGGAQEMLEADNLKEAAQAGIDFVVLDMTAPARLLNNEAEKLDKVVTLSVPKDELSTLFLRGVNLLPVDAIQFEPPLSSEALRALTLEQHVRYRLVRESLRFPALAAVEGALDAAEVKVLVGLGLQGVILRAASRERPDTLRERVATLRRLLEEMPKPPSVAADVPSVGGLAGSPGVAPPQPRPGEPEPEPER